MIHVNVHVGLVCQRVFGDSLYKAAQPKPWNIPRYFKRLAEIQVEIHTRNIPADFPSQRLRNIQRAVGISNHLRSKVLTALQDLPDGNQLCHGDFWDRNILMTSHGAVIIDWNRASCGDQLADLARSTNTVLAFLETNHKFTFSNSWSDRVPDLYAPLLPTPS